MTNWKDLLGALVNFGSDPYLVDTEEDAKGVAEAIDNASICREIEDEDEFKTATRQLGLECPKPVRIFSYVDGSEFLVCYPEDWN